MSSTRRACPRPSGLFPRLAIVAAAAVLLVNADGGAQPQSPDVLLITLDTTRADRMGFLGSTRHLTPGLDAFARSATVFTRAFAQAPITTTSHATLLTGMYPPAHGVDQLGAMLPPSVPYLPDLLQARGYRTAAFVGSLILDPRSGLAQGFGRGFDVYDAGFRLRRPGENRYQTIERRGSDVTARALAWAGTNLSTPSFRWVHLFDPHDPYDPPADLRARFSASPYDGEIAAVDRDAARLIAAAAPTTLIVVAADHGEALGDHGEATHGVFLYDETLHVPLVVRFPGGRGAGLRISARVRLADVAPTILEAVGAQIPRDMQGESLRALVIAAAAPTVGPARASMMPDADRPAYAETVYPRQAFGWSPLASWRSDRYLFVKAPHRELYDLAADPAARSNLADARRRVADAIDAELGAFIQRAAGVAGTAAGRRPAGAEATIDPAAAERLAALGYISGSGVPPAARGGIDPKDRIAVANRLHDAMMAIEDGRFAAAIPLLEKVTASEPGIPIAQLNLGIAYARQKHPGRAAAALKRAVALQPGDMRGHYELASALYDSGDANGAAAEFAVVARTMPNWADARYSLASVFARIQRIDEAIAELRAAIALDARHFRANLLLGRILALRGDTAAALPYLRAAVEIDPASADAKRFLAEAARP